MTKRAVVRSRILFRLTWLTLLALPVRPVLAQTFSPQTADGQIERSRLPNPVLPLAPGALSLGEPPEASGDTEEPRAPDTPGDSDLGVQSLLRARETPRPWSLFADGGFVYTSNVALTNHDPRDDVFYVGEGGVSYDYTISHDLSLSAAAREQYFAYNHFDQLDFGALNFALALSYTAHKLDDVVFSAQLGFTRLTHRGLFDHEFYRNGSLALGAQKVYALGRAQLFSFGGDIDLGVSLPHAAEREEFGASAGYVVQITRHLSAQVGYRAAYYLYAATGREDFNGSGSAGLTYAFTPWCSVGATLSGTVDRSSRPVFDYDVLNSGASAFFRLRF